MKNMWSKAGVIIGIAFILSAVVLNRAGPSLYFGSSQRNIFFTPMLFLAGVAITAVSILRREK